MTRNFTPAPAYPSTVSNGYTMLPGGFVLQWGIVNGSGTNNVFTNKDNGTVTFSISNKAFPNACFGVWINLLYNTAVGKPRAPTTVGNVSYDLNTLSKTRPDWTFTFRIWFLYKIFLGSDRQLT